MIKSTHIRSAATAIGHKFREAERVLSDADHFEVDVECLKVHAVPY